MKSCCKRTFHLPPPPPQTPCPASKHPPKNTPCDERVKSREGPANERTRSISPCRQEAQANDIPSSTHIQLECTHLKSQHRRFFLLFPCFFNFPVFFSTPPFVFATFLFLFQRTPNFSNVSVFSTSLVFQRVRFPNFSVLERVLTSPFFTSLSFQLLRLSTCLNISVIQRLRFFNMSVFSTSPFSSDVPVFNYCIQPPFRPTPPRFKKSALQSGPQDPDKHNIGRKKSCQPKFAKKTT